MANKEQFVQKLADILETNHGLSARAMQQAFKQSTIDEFDDFLLTEGLVERPILLKALSTYYKVPSVDVNGEFFDCLLLRNFPKEFLARNAIIPLMEENANMLVVVAADPHRDGLEAAIRAFTNSDITFFVGLRQDIIDAVGEYYDKSVTEASPDDIDLREEHRDEVDAYTKILQSTEDEYEKEEELSKEDDIRS